MVGAKNLHALKNLSSAGVQIPPKCPPQFGGALPCLLTDQQMPEEPGTEVPLNSVHVVLEVITEIFIQSPSIKKSIKKLVSNEINRKPLIVPSPNGSHRPRWSVIC